MKTKDHAEDEGSSRKRLMKEATIEMDLGDRRNAVCVMDKEGEVIEERSVINDRENMLDAIEVKIKQVDKELEVMTTERYLETERLRQVTGVEPITALSFILTLESPDRFAKAREVVPYLGLAPRRDQSGNSDKQLPMSRKERNIYEK